MKNRIVYKYIGKVLIGFSLLLIIPLLVAVINNEHITPFLIPLLISLLFGFILNTLKISSKKIYSKDGFIIVALSWIIISLISALPFIINKDLHPIDAIFESISGLTTTGATVIDNVEHLSKSILFWRSFMHFIGGMGVLAFVMAIIPLSKNDKSMHLLKAEMPGPSVNKLVPSIKKTLFYLYGIYILLTLTEFILLVIGKTPPFHALLLSFGTAGTGGFALLNNSLASYTTFSKIVVTIFMFLFGVNFNIYFLILMKDFKSAFKSEELRVYLFLYLASVLIVILNTYHLFNNLRDCILQGFFHVSSIITSTGYSIGSVNIYPTNAKVLCLMLMLISACAGSTCGGFKMSRLIICFKSIKRDILKIIHPNSIRCIKFEGNDVPDDIIKSTRSFLFLYIIFILIIMFIVSIDGFSFEVTLNAVFSTFANVGLAFDISTFSIFSNVSKVFLSIGMLLGRLEIFPIIVLFSDLRK